MMRKKRSEEQERKKEKKRRRKVSAGCTVSERERETWKKFYLNTSLSHSSHSLSLTVCASQHIFWHRFGSTYWIIEPYIYIQAHMLHTLPTCPLLLVGISGCSSDDDDDYDDDGRRSLTEDEDEDEDDVKRRERKERRENHTKGSTQISLLTLLYFPPFSLFSF